MTASISPSQSSVRRFISIDRLAFVTSVTWTAARPADLPAASPGASAPPAPPVRFQMSQLSIVPKRRSPASALALAPGTLSRIQAIFGPEKYVAKGNPTPDRNLRSEEHTSDLQSR